MAFSSDKKSFFQVQRAMLSAGSCSVLFLLFVVKAVAVPLSNSFPVDNYDDGTENAQIKRYGVIFGQDVSRIDMATAKKASHGFYRLSDGEESFFGALHEAKGSDWELPTPLRPASEIIAAHRLGQSKVWAAEKANEVVTKAIGGGKLKVTRGKMEGPNSYWLKTSIPKYPTLGYKTMKPSPTLATHSLSRPGVKLLSTTGSNSFVRFGTRSFTHYFSGRPGTREEPSRINSLTRRENKLGRETSHMVAVGSNYRVRGSSEIFGKLPSNKDAVWKSHYKISQTAMGWKLNSNSVLLDKTNYGIQSLSASMVDLPDLTQAKARTLVIERRLNKSSNKPYYLWTLKEAVIQGRGVQASSRQERNNRLADAIMMARTRCYASELAARKKFGLRGFHGGKKRGTKSDEDYATELFKNPMANVVSKPMARFGEYKVVAQGTLEEREIITSMNTLGKFTVNPTKTNSDDEDMISDEEDMISIDLAFQATGEPRKSFAGLPTLQLDGFSDPDLGEFQILELLHSAFKFLGGAK